MFESSMGWMFCVGVISVIGAILHVTRGASFALGTTVALSFAVPVWLEIPIFGIPFSAQTSIAAVFLLAFAIRCPWEIRSSIVWLDFAVAALVVLHAVSDTYHSGNPVQHGLLAYGEWALPYVAGRYAVRDPRNVESLALVVTCVLLVMSLGSIIESVAGINLWEVAFGDRPHDGTARDAQRYGLKRAFGTTLHPIFWGLLLMTLAPWPIALAKWARTPSEKMLGMGTSVIGFLGVLGSVSRAPALGMGVLYAVTGMMWSTLSKWLLIVVATVAVGWIVLDFNTVLSLFERMGGEKRHVTNMRLDGETVEWSSAAHRVVLWQVYWPSLKEAGVIGYGTAATSMMPPEVPHLPKDEEVRKRLRFVDNAFLMFGLRFGWTGMALYTLLLGLAIWTGFRLSRDRSIGVIAGALAAMTIALTLNMMTVWFSYDMGYAALWSWGILAGFSSQQS
ncbi:O-antigen ligase family protein [Planctomicrobium sp. SH527]|uniref:O-antigen ligase family protein n=1 Tax=Planctomicrobium sp. SH527 TaxID=3448123 RepID=UPI003F5AEBA2